MDIKRVAVDAVNETIVMTVVHMDYKGQVAKRINEKMPLAQVKGFRKGAVPKELVEKMGGVAAFSSRLDTLFSMILPDLFFAETEDSGFSAELNRYFQAVENLRTSPNSELYKTTLKNAGTTIVESLQNIYKSIENQQVSEKNELKVNVGKVNSIFSFVMF